ncbi:Lysine-specific demethylase 8 [Modicella reniformis]|uniref:Lysine-specific demethylase 8 n=1 Tax=Modicella reniformis TaxID=1440133 RepID=A0A9P6ILW7_9FUNG|nr:Lysine-specific demethylase 8 [Modicella reniformis]
MFNAIASNFQRAWSVNESEITRVNCGFAPFCGLQEARKLLSSMLSESQQKNQSQSARALAVQSDVLVDYAHDMLHSFPYRDVPSCWRELYTDAGILKALALGFLAVSELPDSNSIDIIDTRKIGQLRQALVSCDNVLVMAGASGLERKAIIYELIDAIETMIEGQQEALPSAQKRAKTEASVKLDIRFLDCIYLPWMPSSGMSTVAPVPIEIGSKYTDEQWTQKLVTMREFIEQYIILSLHKDDKEGDHDENGQDQQGPIGYLAQHDLFDQIPRLRRDIDIPDYCMIEPREQDGYRPPDDVLLNAWFGPRGTVSPMHTDPYHNLLAQVVGRKYVRLYAPDETAKLYCYGSMTEKGSEAEQEADMLGNTSQVDVEQPDLDRHPLFAEAKYAEAILDPGEVLYIPFQWWHYIRSLSTSFSISFWF